MTPTEQLLASLTSRPGRGGIRLSYRQADHVIGLIGAAKLTGLENRQLRRFIDEQRAQICRLEQQLGEAHGEAIAAKAALREARRA